MDRSVHKDYHTAFVTLLLVRRETWPNQRRCRSRNEQSSEDDVIVQAASRICRRVSTRHKQRSCSYASDENNTVCIATNVTCARWSHTALRQTPTVISYNDTKLRPSSCAVRTDWEDGECGSGKWQTYSDWNLTDSKMQDWKLTDRIRAFFRKTFVVSELIAA